MQIKKKSFKQAEFIPPNLVMCHCSATVLLENKSILTKINSWNMTFAETFHFQAVEVYLNKNYVET